MNDFTKYNMFYQLSSLTTDYPVFEGRHFKRLVDLYKPKFQEKMNSTKQLLKLCVNIV